MPMIAFKGRPFERPLPVILSSPDIGTIVMDTVVKSVVDVVAVSVAVEKAVREEVTVVRAPREGTVLTKVVVVGNVCVVVSNAVAVSVVKGLVKVSTATTSFVEIPNSLAMLDSETPCRAPIQAVELAISCRWYHRHLTVSDKR